MQSAFKTEMKTTNVFVNMASRDQTVNVSLLSLFDQDGQSYWKNWKILDYTGNFENMGLFQYILENDQKILE